MTAPTGLGPPTAPPALVDEQVGYLVSLGMDVPDRELARRCLNHIGFHRLRSYWQPFASSDSGRRFEPGASFNGVMARYMFDQRLRSLLLEAFSYIEISVRTQWAYQLVNGFGHGEFAHQNPKLFNRRRHSENLPELQRLYQRIARQDARDFNRVAIWDLMPVMSFGQLSKWYASLDSRAIRQAIAQNYGIDEVILKAALRQLSEVRNICAHHERLWNRVISGGLKIPRRLRGSAATNAAFNTAAPDKIYNVLVMTAHLMAIITPHGDWTARFLAFRAEDAHRDLPDADLGFPVGWRNLPLWN